MDYSDTHYAELIAQKKRLQQLESEYARKIEKLKEAQALRQAEPRAAAPQAFSLPQPSLHDLTQDKLILSSEDLEAEDDEQQIPATANRRRSFRESGSFTKPKLSHLETPAASLVPVKHAKASSCDSGTGGLPELLLGLNIEDLKQRYQMCARLSEILQEEMCSLRWPTKDIKTPAKVKSHMLQNISLCKEYISRCRRSLLCVILFDSTLLFCVIKACFSASLSPYSELGHFCSV